MTDAATAARDQPLIAIDVVPVSFTTGGGLRVATARRANAPYAGREALPGVLLDAAERLADGARRALRTKTGIDAAAVRHLAQVGAFDGPERDPRDAAVSIAFLAVVAPEPGGASDGPLRDGGDPRIPGDTPMDRHSSDGGDPRLPADARAVWHPLDGGDHGLPFDHDAIVRAARDQVRTRLWRDTALTRALLGEVFTTSDAAQLHAALHGAPPDAGNLNRALRTNPALVRTTVPARTGGRGGRPPATWTWTD
ncbi:NUDIX domain-containing protein [Curtobacterium sp. MCBA15_012]|uniref:NUDIX domain-containing protein n=1 Tax=Curtobacterium sp. MCBA15_012 TaxID=1898738 RepID=UPI0008DDC68E|nr:NUDIX domain-containing protein [Curtobacterium sp. MCBA15_012]WIA99851.1 NUDIX hydrolase [Curtobacterium sp. MCBA15_012]